MKLLSLVLACILALTACNQTDTAKQQLKDNTTSNVSNVSNGNNGKAIGKDYGGKGQGYGQVKKNEPGQAPPPPTEAPAPIQWTPMKAYEDFKNVFLGGHYQVGMASDSTELKIWDIMIYDNTLTQEQVMKAVNQLNSYNLGTVRKVIKGDAGFQFVMQDEFLEMAGEVVYQK